MSLSQGRLLSESKRGHLISELRNNDFTSAVPSFIYADPDIYKMEMERIFTKCWLFVGHVSEIPDKGDYVTREMGELPVIVSRAGEDEISVLLNVCRHRGMKLCRTDAGNSAHFRCMYHGFTYKNSGELIGVPFHKEAYGEDLDKSEYSLFHARVDTYKGLIFATWNDDPEPLKDFLGHMKWYLDLISGRAEMEMIGAPQKWEVEGNWKLAAENFASDAYHTGYTHGSIVELGLAPKAKFAMNGHHISAGHGHGLGLGTGTPGSPEILPKEAYDEYRKNLSEDQYRILLGTRNLHANVFPNFSILLPTVKVDDELISVVTLRLWVPKGVNKITIYSWFLVEKNASEAFKKKSERGYIFSFGSSGIFEQDDTENWTDITENTRRMLGAQDFFMNTRMGMSKEPISPRDFPGPGDVIYDDKYNEANLRAFYQYWKKMLLTDGSQEV